MERVIHFGFWAAASVIVGMSALLYDAITKSHDSSQRLYQSHEVLDTIHRAREDYTRAELAARSYVLAPNRAELDEHVEMLRQVDAGVASLKALLPGDPQQQQRLQQLDASLAGRVPTLDAWMDGHQADADALKPATLKERQAFLQLVSDMEREELRVFKERGEAAQRRFDTTLLTLAGATLAGLLILLPLYLNAIAQTRARKRAELLEQESSAILRLTVDSVQGMIVYTDRNGRYKVHNKAYAQLMGDADKSLVGSTVRDVLGKSAYDATEPWIDQALQGKAVQGERRHVLADGTTADIRVSLVPHFGASGQVLGYFSQLTDITEFKRKEALLLEKTSFQKAILNSARFSIIAADKNGLIQSFNVGAELMLGYSAAEVVGKASASLFHDRREVVARAGVLSRELGARIEPGNDAFIAKARLGDADENEWTYIRKDGSRIPVFLSVTALRTEQGDIIGYLGIALNITPQKEVETQLKHAKAEAEAASRAKSAFLATMSHEIRTPMNGVIGMVEVLARSRLDEQQVDMVKTIRDSATVLLNLIDDILDFSKIEAGRLTLEQAPVSIVDLVEGIGTSLLPVAAGKGVDLSLFISPEVPERVLSDDVRLRQVLYNLAGNAIKFSGGRPERRGRVSIRTEVEQAVPLRLAFRVIDNGIGMEPETVSQLFTAFMQAEVSTTRRFGGTGLGLAICGRLVKLMQGEISVQSVFGEGSTFTVVLPFESADAAPERSLPDLHGLDCVLLDSPELEAGDLRAYLEHRGARVHVAADTQGAAAIAASLSAPTVVIQDAENEHAARQTLPAFARLPQLRHLLLTRGGRRQMRVDAPDVVSLDAEALLARHFLRAVAVAAGRASPEVFYGNTEDEHAPAEAAPPSIAEARAQGRLILVAEDDAINQKVILRQLGLLGYAAEIAGSGTEALRLWREASYALLLTDLHMPQLDGYGLATAIRSEEAQGTHMPILALTANALRGESNRARAAGMDDYLTKPVQLQVLGAALEKWLPRNAAATPAAPAQPVVVDQAAAVDVSVLKALVGDDADTVREFLADYRSAAQRLGTELRQAFDGGDTRQAGAIAHKLKSSSRSVGALALGDACAELENACKAGNKDAVAQCMPRFNAALADAEAELAGMLAEQQSEYRIDQA